MAPEAGLMPAAEVLPNGKFVDATACTLGAWSGTTKDRR